MRTVPENERRNKRCDTREKRTFIESEQRKGCGYRPPPGRPAPQLIGHDKRKQQTGQRELRNGGDVSSNDSEHQTPGTQALSKYTGDKQRRSQRENDVERNGVASEDDGDLGDERPQRQTSDDGRQLA